VKLARILVHDFADDPHLLQTGAELFDLCAQYAADVEALVVKQDSFDTIVKVAAMAMEARNKSTARLYPFAERSMCGPYQ